MIFFLSLKINFFSSSSSSFSSLPGGCFTKERLLSALIVYRRISSEQSIYRFHFQFVSSPLSRSRSSLFDSRRSRVVSKERISLFTSLVGRPIFIIANQSFHLAVKFRAPRSFCSAPRSRFDRIYRRLRFNDRFHFVNARTRTRTAISFLTAIL